MFRTKTGQTGTDAYQYEAAQITNALRELDARAMRLAEAMADEVGNAPYKMSIPSKQHLDAFVEGVATRGFLLMQGTADSAEYLGRVARGIADPNYVVSYAEDNH